MSRARHRIWQDSSSSWLMAYIVGAVYLGWCVMYVVLS